jgi:hypothetical protein
MTEPGLSADSYFLASRRSVLITFKCKDYASIPMFQEVALRLLHLMGHTGAVPGALGVEDVPLALNALRVAIDQNPASLVGPDKITLRQRAQPLLGLLEHAEAHQYRVIWE